MNCNLYDYAKPALLESLCKELNFPGDLPDRIPAHLKTLNLAALAEHFPRLFSLETGAEASKAIDELCKSEADPSGDSGLRSLAVYLAGALHTRELYRELGIGAAIYTDTILVFRRFVLEHLRSYGRYGFDRSFWTYRQLSANLFRLGALEFEMTTLPAGREPVGPAVPGDPVLSVHIPSDAAMDREALDSSYHMAREFFARHFPGFMYRCCCCNTWLLSPVLKGILSPSSRILSFQEDYAVTSVNPEDTSAIGWVFGRNYDRYEELPEDTSLMRGIKSILLSGGSVGAAAGYVRDFECK